MNLPSFVFTEKDKQNFTLFTIALAQYEERKDRILKAKIVRLGGQEQYDLWRQERNRKKRERRKCKRPMK